MVLKVNVVDTKYVSIVIAEVNIQDARMNYKTR